jgi:hypothetical protein
LKTARAPVENAFVELIAHRTRLLMVNRSVAVGVLAPRDHVEAVNRGLGVLVGQRDSQVVPRDLGPE